MPEKDNGLKSMRDFTTSAPIPHPVPQTLKTIVMTAEQQLCCCIILPGNRLCKIFSLPSSATFGQCLLEYWSTEGYLTTQLIYSSINQPKERYCLTELRLNWLNYK